jgi:hypothetical protein
VLAVIEVFSHIQKLLHTYLVPTSKAIPPSANKMRYLTVLPVLLATALAKEDTQAQSPASNSSEKDPTPIGQLWAAKWQDADLTPTYSKNCHSNTAYKAQLYSLGEIYPTLKDWAPQLKVFYHKQLYPGAWEGEDVHGDGRMLLKMGVEELPGPVREWYVCFFLISRFFQDWKNLLGNDNWWWLTNGINTG